MPLNNTFSVQQMNETMKKLNTEEMNRWVAFISRTIAPPKRADFFEMFHFFETPEEPHELKAEVTVAQPSSRPCKFLSETVRESEETGQLTGTQETCVHPNHDSYIRLRRTMLGLSTMLRLLVNRSRLGFPVVEDLNMDPLASMLSVPKDMGCTLDEFVAAMQEDSPQRRLQFLEEGILNVSRAVDTALKDHGKVVKFESNNNHMTDHFSGTSQ